jgi:hypothetical protein
LVSPDGALLFTSNDPAIGREEEYASAVSTGNDLSDGGDGDLNGFSARGWDCDAASRALGGTLGVLACLEEFVEGMALCEKERGAVMVDCCGRWSDGVERVRLGRSGELESERRRVGPLLLEGSTLANALKEMEQYYTLCAENSSQRWRGACWDEHHRVPSSSLHKIADDTTNGSANSTCNGGRTIDESLIQGLIPKMRASVKKAKERNLERELALSDIRHKVAEAQENLKKQKEWSSSHWQRVKEENRKIDEIVNQQVREQNELMQKLRRERYSERLERDASETPIS